MGEVLHPDVFLSRELADVRENWKRSLRDLSLAREDLAKLQALLDAAERDCARYVARCKLLEERAQHAARVLSGMVKVTP